MNRPTLSSKLMGGAVGITENPSALRKWMVAGPEVSQLVAHYEAASETKETAEYISHHEQAPRSQRRFIEQVDKFFQAVNGLGNPFQEESQDMLSLDTKDIAHPTASALISSHCENGRARFHEFLKGLSSEEEITFYESIKKNRIDFFRQEPASVNNSKEKVLKEDCHLLSKPFISCQSRE